MTEKKHHAHDYRAEAEEMIHDVAEKAEHIEQEMEVYVKATSQYIKKNPLKSTAIAAVAGILIGKLFGK